MMIIWWSKHVGVTLSVLVCDIWINVLLHTSALVGPLHITNKCISWTVTHIELKCAVKQWKKCLCFIVFCLVRFIGQCAEHATVDFLLTFNLPCVTQHSIYRTDRTCNEMWTRHRMCYLFRHFLSAIIMEFSYRLKLRLSNWSVAWGSATRVRFSHSREVQPLPSGSATRVRFSHSRQVQPLPSGSATPVRFSHSRQVHPFASGSATRVRFSHSLQVQPLAWGSATHVRFSHSREVQPLTSGSGTH
jgi:hypothetical protein